MKEPRDGGRGNDWEAPTPGMYQSKNELVRKWVTVGVLAVFLWLILAALLVGSVALWRALW